MAKVEWPIPLNKGWTRHSTLGRAFPRLDAAEFLVAVQGVVDKFAGCLRGSEVATGGNAVRATFDKAAGQSPLH